MTGWLFDTNVVSEIRTPHGNQSVMAWVSDQRRADQHFSAVSLMELRYGVEVAPLVKRQDIQTWIDDIVIPWFESRILSIDDATLLTWRRMMEAIKRQGSVSAAPDLLVAAQAQNHGLIVASRDVRIFSAAGIPVLNPWTQELTIPGRAAFKLKRPSLDEALRALRRTR
jgi:hypothetical protein